ncbi:MAG TPA: formate--phosphoribosylaminoimidazolecarboxamide ligase [Candidatus Methanofastidiosa archaeon]|nr:formate--phosphoribosylaminoimidazolecarboxamide ligase [Candidatus Methanofastidiosa archaeon]HPR42606.1 formate--phosphoribosylaminoimidazolecarboxamide ligase [Candidatus Methanofastidiosa archaeon]
MWGDEIKVSTLGSHSALNILRGAKDEGFETLLVSPKGRRFYERFNVADDIIYVDDMGQFLKSDDERLSGDVVMVPHGSFISYLSLDFIEDEFNTRIFGNKYLFKWESDRDLEKSWLEGSGIMIPRTFGSPEEIDRPVIVKSFGAKGGMGYFLARDLDDFMRKSKDISGGYQIQEYIVGVPIYFHFFYSPLRDELELLSVDRRYESNVDSLGRVPAGDQEQLGISPSYTVVGNFPIVIRESLLEQVFDIGDRVVEESKKISERGLMGPFCLETICTSDLDIVTFEISARIVAGTNPFMPSSPYTYAKYGKDVSCGRRIAMELRDAISTDSVEEVTT